SHPEVGSHEVAVRAVLVGLRHRGDSRRAAARAASRRMAPREHEGQRLTMYRGKLLAVAVSVAALARTAAPAGAAPVRPEPQSDHIIAVLIGKVRAPP